MLLARAVPLALLALLALPNAASAALKWRSCVDAPGIRCSTLNVPLDRAGGDPGTGPPPLPPLGPARGRAPRAPPAADRPHRPPQRPDADVSLRRPGRGRRERDAERGRGA